MSRKNRSKLFLCWLLASALVFQPVLLEVALAQANTEVQTVDDSDKQTQDAANEVKSVDTSSWTLKTGNFIKDGIMSIAKSLISKIRKADREVKKAKTEMEQSKTTVDKGAKDSTASSQDTKGAVATSDSARDQKTLDQSSDAKAKSQSGLLKVGNQLNGIADILQTVAVTLGSIGTVLTGLSAIPYVGGVCAFIGGILKTVAAVLVKVSAVIKVAASAVIAAANAAKLSDVDFDKYSKEAGEAWKNSGNEFLPPKKAVDVNDEGNVEESDKPEIVIDKPEDGSSKNETEEDAPGITEEADVPTDTNDESENSEDSESSEKTERRKLGNSSED